jgi:hypothetical protein
MTIDPLTRHAEQAGFAHVASDMVFDAEHERPRLIAALAPLCPDIQAIMAGLRRGVPVAPNASEGVTGQFYRLPGHFRSLCCAVPDAKGPEELWAGDVIAFKGTEPLMPDFDEYLRWMMTAPFRGSDLPLGLHFPLVVNVPPGAVPLDECLREQRMAAAVHERHLEVYGELAHAPVPLFVHRCPVEVTTSYVDALDRHLTPQAFERVESRALAGCGVSIWYYPTAPIRVDDLRRLAATNPQLRVAPAEGEETIALWCRLFARFLQLGFMPYAPWNKGRGSCIDAGNACIDGGFTDLLMLVPFESIPDDRWFRLSLLASARMLSHTVSMFTVSLGARPAERPDASLDPLSQVFLQPRLLDAIRAETAAGREPDARIVSCFALDGLEGLVSASRAADYPNTPYRASVPSA